MSLRTTLLLTTLGLAPLMSGCKGDDGDGDGYEASDDCDDEDPQVNPGVLDLAGDGEDANCDGVDGHDGDGDGVASEWSGGDDCDDEDDTTYPGADIGCDGGDHDCDGAVDSDADSDGYADDACGGDDCDDADPRTHPGAYELCDGIHNDCDTSTAVPADESDEDDDGFVECVGWMGDDAAVTGGGDCDDADDEIYPGADELCDEVDSDCDGEARDDDSLDAGWWYLDGDTDGFGDPVTGVTACTQPGGSVGVAGDCDDEMDDVYPGAPDEEPCDGVDTACTGLVERWVDCDDGMVQTAIDLSIDGDQVCVYSGTCTENLDFSGKDVHVLGVDGRDETFLVAELEGPVVTFESGEGEGAVLEGFTLTGGMAWKGGGVSITSAEPTLVDLVITENEASNGGGGVHIDHGGVVIRDTLILGNTTDLGGGGVKVMDASWAELEDVVLAENEAAYGGGMWVFDGSEATLDRVYFVANEAGIAGGIGLSVAEAELTNVTVAGNSAYELGGGIMTWLLSELDLVNVSVVGNWAETGGGVAITNDIVDMVNVLIAYNGSDSEVPSGVYAPLSGSGSPMEPVVSFAYCDVYGNDYGDFYLSDDPTGTDGNISVEPGLMVASPYIDPWEWHLFLHPDSDLIDAGDPSIDDPDGSDSDIGAFGGPGADVAYYTDADADDMYDGWEEAFGLDTSTDDSAGDLDSDGLTNIEEFDAGTLANDHDTDGDGTPDGTDPDPLDPLSS